jgi:hypothetical protein
VTGVGCALQAVTPRRLRTCVGCWTASRCSRAAWWTLGWERAATRGWTLGTTRNHAPPLRSSVVCNSPWAVVRRNASQCGAHGVGSAGGRNRRARAALAAVRGILLRGPAAAGEPRRQARRHAGGLHGEGGSGRRRGACIDVACAPRGRSACSRWSSREGLWRRCGTFAAGPSPALGLSNDPLSGVISGVAN